MIVCCYNLSEPIPAGMWRLMMLTPIYLTINPSVEHPWTDHDLFEPSLLTLLSNWGHIVFFWSRSLLCPLLPGKKKHKKTKTKKLSFWLHLKLCSDIWFDTSAQKSWAFCCIKGEVGRKRDGLGVWLMQTVTFRMDREQDPNGQQSGIYSISHDKQYGKSI